MTRSAHMLLAARSQWWLVLLILSVASGCKAKPIFPPVEPPLVWPSPPESARIQYVGNLLTDQSLKPRKSLGKSLEELVFGKDDARSMLSPYALCTDGGERLFVCDSNAQLVHVFDLRTRRYEQWRPMLNGRSFSQPVGIALDQRGRLLVSDSVAGVIFVFDSHGKQIGELGAGILKRPCGIACGALDGTERICIADAGLHQVIVLDLDGQLIQRVGRRGTALGQFNYPTNIALDSQCNLYISDTLNFRVQVLDPAGNPIRQIGSQGDMPGYFSQPKGIALNSENHIYIVDAHFESVQIFDSNGQLLLTFGEEGSGPGQFWLPAGIHIDSHDRVWIADSYNRRVQVFDYLPEASR